MMRSVFTTTSLKFLRVCGFAMVWKKMEVVQAARQARCLRRSRTILDSFRVMARIYGPQCTCQENQFSKRSPSGHHWAQIRPADPRINLFGSAGAVKQIYLGS